MRRDQQQAERLAAEFIDAGADLEIIYADRVRRPGRRAHTGSSSVVDRLRVVGSVPLPCQTSSMGHGNVLALKAPGQPTDVGDKILVAALTPSIREVLGLAGRQTSFRKLFAGAAAPGVTVRARADGAFDLEQFRPVPGRVGLHRCRVSLKAAQPGPEFPDGPSVLLCCRFFMPAGRAAFGVAVGILWAAFGIALAAGAWLDPRANTGGAVLIATFGSLWALIALTGLFSLLPWSLSLLPWKRAERRYVLSWLERITDARPVAGHDAGVRL